MTSPVSNSSLSEEHEEMREPDLQPIIELNHLDIIPSYVCRSSNCVDCYQKNRGDYTESCRKVLDIEALIPFLEAYTVVLRVQSFGLFGGEITDFARSVEIVDSLTSVFPGIRLEIVTNGQNPECILRMAQAANYRDNLIMEFSIDGDGSICDKLRGKNGYFYKVLESIEGLADLGLSNNIRVNSRYYPEYEKHLFPMADLLKERFGIKRSSIGIQSCISANTCMSEACNYMYALRRFAVIFWQDRQSDNYQRWHPRHLPYNARIRTVFCVPGVQPDGFLYTCNNFNHGLRIKDIYTTDVSSLIKSMLDVAKQMPTHCNECQFGRSVWANYIVMQSENMNDHIYFGEQLE